MWRVLVFMAVVLVSTASSNAAPRFVTPAAPFVGSGLGTPIRCPNPSGPIVKCDYTQTCCEVRAKRRKKTFVGAHASGGRSRRAATRSTAAASSARNAPRS